MNIPVMKREHFQQVKVTSTGPRAHIGMMLKHGKTKKEATNKFTAKFLQSLNQPE